MLWVLVGSVFAAPPAIIDLLQVRYLGTPELHPDSEHLTLHLGGWRLDAEAEPFGDTAAGWWYDGGPTVISLGDGTMQTSDVQGWSATHAPDGTLAYVGRDGEGGAAIFVQDAAGPRALDTGGTWPSSLRWSADGRSLYFLARAPMSDADREAAWWAAGVQEVDAPQRTVRLHRVQIESGTAEALSPEHLHVEDYALHPRGGPPALVTAETSRDYDAYFMARVQLLHDDGTLEALSEPGCAERPTYEPAGKALAWIGCGGGILTDQVWAHRDGQTTEATAGLDITATRLDWTERGLFVWTQQGMHTGLLRQRKGGWETVPLGHLSLRSSAMHPSGRWAAVVINDPARPDRLGRLDVRTGGLEELYDPNPAWSGFDWPSTEVVQWTADDGQRLEGLLHRPPAGIPVRGLLVNPHGGPNSVSGMAFGDHHAFTSAGYAVFQPNFRGGVGYGRAFYEANRGHIADRPFTDIEAGVDHLVQQGFSEEALFYGGWSYGGFMAAWTLGHTDRYRAIIAGGTISSRLVQYTMSSNTERRAAFIFGGPPWTHREAYDRQDPNRFLAGATTPTLLFHGANDDATPVAHARILHRALKDLGVATELYVYPDERHGAFEPARQRHVLERWVSWMDEHGPSEPPDKP